MENYIALLLIVMPGYLSRLIYRHISDEVPDKDKFKIIMESLLYDVIILPLVYLIIHYITPDIDQIKMFFTIPQYIGMYAICALFLSIVVSVSWKYLKPKYNHIVNYIRKARGLNEITLNQSVFTRAFNDGLTHWVEVYKDDKLITRGLILHFWDSNAELYVCDAEDCISPYLDIEGKVKQYKGVYVDYKHNIVIKEIDTEIKES